MGPVAQINNVALAFLYTRWQLGLLQPGPGSGLVCVVGPVARAKGTFRRDCVLACLCFHLEWTDGEVGCAWCGVTKRSWG